MKAYVVLAGGGVKGAALAGCLKAAHDAGVDPLGYAGTSAGSIVALLAALGYSPDELSQSLETELKFNELLGGDLAELKTLTAVADVLDSKLDLFKFLWHNRALLKKLNKNLGIYSGTPITTFLKKKIADKLPTLKNVPDPTFAELQAAGCKPFKVVTSDLGRRAHRVLSAREDGGTSVLSAIRASMSYPLVFTPVKMGLTYSVDGGLTTNLPVFVFEEERKNNGLPVIAFDLAAPPASNVEQYAMKNYIGDMITTALESGDAIQRQLLHGLYYVPVMVPDNIGTLKFDLTPGEVSALFKAGYAGAAEFFFTLFRKPVGIPTVIERLQATHAPRSLVTPVLRAFAKVVEELTHAKSVRTHIMLPTGNGTRIVVYQYNMDGDQDSDLELAMDSGCSGEAWKKRVKAVADLERAKKAFANWGLTPAQQAKVRKDRQAMVSTPMFLPELGKKDTEGKLVGILSADSSTPLAGTGWKDAHTDILMNEWAAIFTRLLH